MAFLRRTLKVSLSVLHWSHLWLGRHWGRPWYLWSNQLGHRYGCPSGWLRKPTGGFLLVASLAISTVLPFIIISQIQFASHTRGSSEGNYCRSRRGVRVEFAKLYKSGRL